MTLKYTVAICFVFPQNKLDILWAQMCFTALNVLDATIPSLSYFYPKNYKQFITTTIDKSVQTIDHIRTLSIGLELACNGG